MAASQREGRGYTWHLWCCADEFSNFELNRFVPVSVLQPSKRNFLPHSQQWHRAGTPLRNLRWHGREGGKTERVQVPTDTLLLTRLGVVIYLVSKICVHPAVKQVGSPELQSSPLHIELPASWIPFACI